MRLNIYLKILFISSSLLFTSTIFAGNQYQLIFAVDFIRHGDRTPTITLPNDAYQWQQGLGELTPKGMRQLYTLGKSLRKTYVETAHLLPPKYIANTIYVRSSDYHRTLMSAQALLLGLYPLGTGPLLTKQTFALPGGYQPVPIHTVDSKKDDLFAPSDVDSKQFQALLNQYAYTQPFWQAKEQEFQPKLANWSMQTGYKMSQIRSAVALGDALYIRKLYGINSPAGLSQKDVEEIINLAQWVMVNKFNPMPIGKFMTHQFWNKLKNDMESAAATHTNNSAKPLKYALYLGHDSNILSLMSAMGLPLSTVPGYGADLRFELLNDKQQFLVKVSYNGKTIKLPHCETLCSLEQFFKSVE